MKSVTKFNGLHGTVATRENIISLIETAKQEEQFSVVQRLETVLNTYPGEKSFAWENDGDAIEVVPNSFLHCLEYQQDDDDEISGLGKAVSPSDVYDLITNRMIELIKNANRNDYTKTWTAKQYGHGYTIPFNFVSKKRYRGVNVLMLAGLQPMENPFFLTFKQVKDLKGTVKKGAKGFEVVYFTKIWKVEDKPKNAKFSSYDKTKVETFKTENGIDNDLGVIPMLKYYHVYNGSDIEGIDFKLSSFKTGFIDAEVPADEKNRLPIAEAIIKNYPKQQPVLKFGGDRAFYQPGSDKIQMPYLSDFATVQDYYRTLLHEYSHSTGANDRLNRDFSGRQGSKPYAFEELVAELGATFLSAEAGIIWHTNKNHAAYLKGWNSVLTQIQDDNKFIMRASTLAQKLSDFVLQFDANGNPLYFKDIEELKPEPIKITKPKAVKKVVAKPTTEQNPKFKIGNSVQISDFGTEAKILSFRLNRNKEYVYKCKYIAPINEIFEAKESELQLFKDWKPTRPKTESKPAVILTNPTPFSIKPKSISVATAINDILGLPKFKKVKPLIANLVYNKFKNKIDFEDENLTIQLVSDYELALLKNDSDLHTFEGYNDDISLTALGINFIKAVTGRLESLRNQKNNYAMFDGLAGAKNKIINCSCGWKWKLKEGGNDPYICHKCGNNTLFDVKKEMENTAWFPKYTQFKNKPKEAIKHLLKVKKGDCISALYREDIGYIDIPYGENDKNNKGFGLKHIVEKHGKEIAELGFKIEDFIPVVIQLGKFKKSTQKEGRILLEGSMFRIVVEKSKNKTFVLTAFDLREKRTGLTGIIDGINFEEKLRKHNKIIDGAGFTISPLYDKTLISKNKVTKTIPIIKKPALKSPFIDLPQPSNKNSLAERLKNKANSNHEYYKIDDQEIANFLGKIEKKQKESVAITLAGGQGSMKTRFCFRLMNAFAQNYKVGHASIEEHPESKLYEDKIHQYLNAKATNNISAPEISNIQDVHKLCRENDVIIIDSFSKLQDMQKGCELDKDFRKAYDGKLFIIVYQQTTDGKMRGGSKSQFDGDIVSFIEKKPNYQDNYVYFDKNRYSDKNLEELKYTIFSGKLEMPVVEALPEPVNFSFNVIEK